MHGLQLLQTVVDGSKQRVAAFEAALACSDLIRYCTYVRVVN